ncbi:hypothetical protein [Streptomyces sp. C8S0]|uniref:hypothetical protein n=1 Tax=Streptomyces sp. C8S0 TaxID=2585716 RepID=UPI001D05116F|nr:hypothetical protein [Streptomyces sp. C8S0]
MPPATAPKKPTAKSQEKQAALARTHDALFDVTLTAGRRRTPHPGRRRAYRGPRDGAARLETYQVQLGGLARKPQPEQVHKALAALLDAGGTLPVTALAQRAGMPTTRADGFAAVLRQLLNYDGVQVLETLPDGAPCASTRRCCANSSGSGTGDTRPVKRQGGPIVRGRPARVMRCDAGAAERSDPR